MKTIATVLALGMIFVVAIRSADASGRIGVCAIVERVAFEPNEQKPERIKIWGAFAFMNGGIERGAASEARRGYLYFKLPSIRAAAEAAKKEWSDLKTVAGKGQAVAFGDVSYFGSIDKQMLGTGIRFHSGILGFSNPFDSPDEYKMNTGIVLLSNDGNHSSVIKQLKEALKR